ncbi:MAG: hypothetical protein WCF78_01530 [archaeon]
MSIIDIIIIIVLILLITGNLTIFAVGHWLTIVLVVILIIWVVRLLTSGKK